MRAIICWGATFTSLRVVVDRCPGAASKTKPSRPARVLSKLLRRQRRHGDRVMQHAEHTHADAQTKPHFLKTDILFPVLGHLFTFITCEGVSNEKLPSPKRVAFELPLLIFLSGMGFVYSCRVMSIACRTSCAKRAVWGSTPCN